MQNNILLSKSKLGESNKKSFIIFGVIHKFLHILQYCRYNKHHKTLAKLLDPPGSSQPRGRQVGPMGGGPPRPCQGEASGLDPCGSAATARVARCAHARPQRASCTAMAAAQGGAGEAGPERGRGSEHGVF